MPQYTNDDFLEAMTPGQNTTTMLVASRVGCTVQTANKRLKQLADVDEEPRVEFATPLWLEAHPNSTRDLVVRRIPEGGDPFHTPPPGVVSSGKQAGESPTAQNGNQT